MKLDATSDSKSIAVLQISDLHRNYTHSISNATLLHSLQQDFNRYSKLIGERIDLVIVNGDIVQGISPTEENPEKVLDLQYKEAENFLGKFAEIYLGENRERVVIVPGNHDVSWYHSVSSMKPIFPSNNSNAPLEKQKLLKNLYTTNSSIRWSWNTFEFYRIEDREQYNRRFESFCKFYNNFYENKRKYSLNPDEQFDIFDFPKFNLTVLGLNSCFESDHCNYIGKINPDCIANAAMKLRQNNYNNRLFIAVWHHGIKGAPIEMDYMDSRTMENLIDLEVSVGLHGHQHKNEIISEYSKISSSKKIIVISAGSICAAPHELPSGYRRSYNLIVFTPDLKKVKLHVREMKHSGFDSPIWGEALIEGFDKSEVEIDILERPPKPFNMISMLEKIENLIRQKEYDDALSLLNTMDSINPFVRKFKFECYTQLTIEDTIEDTIVKEFYPPQSNSEIFFLLDLLWQKKDILRLKELFQVDIVQKSKDQTVNQEVQKYMKLVENYST